MHRFIPRLPVEGAVQSVGSVHYRVAVGSVQVLNRTSSYCCRICSSSKTRPLCTADCSPRLRRTRLLASAFTIPVYKTRPQSHRHLSVLPAAVGTITKQARRRRKVTPEPPGHSRTASRYARYSAQVYSGSVQQTGRLHDK